MLVTKIKLFNKKFYVLDKKNHAKLINWLNDQSKFLMVNNCAINKSSIDEIVLTEAENYDLINLLGWDQEHIQRLFENKKDWIKSYNTIIKSIAIDIFWEEVKQHEMLSEFLDTKYKNLLSIN